MIIKIKNKKTYNGDGFYVGRPSPLSNPYIITESQSRDKVIKMYGKYLISRIKNNDRKVIDELEKMVTYLIENRKINLICHCYPLPCHAEIIKKVLLDRIYTGNWILQ